MTYEHIYNLHSIIMFTFLQFFVCRWKKRSTKDQTFLWSYFSKIHCIRPWKSVQSVWKVLVSNPWCSSKSSSTLFFLISALYLMRSYNAFRISDGWNIQLCKILIILWNNAYIHCYLYFMLYFIDLLQRSNIHSSYFTTVY